jgi:general secretion pathway protein D
MKRITSIAIATIVSALLIQSSVDVLMAQPRGAPSQDGGEDYAKDSNTEINVKNADIAAIVRIFSRKTKRNFILDEKVRGKVSIYLPGKVSAEESLRILDSVLALKGFSSVPIGENLWKIVPSKEARQSTIPTLTESRPEKPTAAVVTRLINLKYVSAQDIQQILSQLISGDGLVNAYTGTNSLIIIDSEDNIERLVNLVDELDVPFSNREMTIIPIQYADAQDIAQKLGDILGDSSKKDGSSGDLTRASLGDGGAPPPGAAGGAPRVTGSGKTVSARGLEPKIIADQRTNSIIVVADGDTTARVRALISQLDSKIDLSGNKFYVYRCQHANAEELAQVLSGLAGGGGGASSTGGFGSGSRSGSGLSGGGSGLSTSQSGGQSSLSSNRNKQSGGMGQSSLGQNSQGGGRQGPMSTQLGDNISITADPATNSLIIAASKLDYERIRALLSQIDVKRRQALVEATLLEVSIDHSIRSSTSFLGSTGGADGGGLIKSDFANKPNNLNSLFTSPTELQGFTLAAASAGSLKLPGGLTVPTQSLLISAAQNNNNINVLSAPTILATDNEEAQIVVGQNVPFLASTSTNATNLNNTFNQVDRQDVGITLRITPQISSRDYVTLKVFTEVSDLIASTINSTLGPTTTKRQSETTIIAKDGQMIVTGGLISDDVSETDEGVPYLKDIPVLGQAFKANSQARKQKNLLIFLTPRIVKDQFDARDATIESRDHLEDVIANYEVNPDRQHTLRNSRIDQIAESVPYEGAKPGTILPPQKYIDEANPKASAPAKEKTVIVDDPGKKDVLDLDKGASKPAAKAATNDDLLDLDALPSSSSPKSSLKSSAVTTAPRGAAAGMFVVVELVRKDDAKKDLPFLARNSRGIGGIVLPAESSDYARSFFQSKGDYSYVWNGQHIPVRIRSVYPSLEAASLVYPGLSAGWYSLSPYEIMNLGKGPWSKKGSR